MKRTSAVSPLPAELGHLFEESGCTPSMWHDLHRSAVPSGERRPMLAILEDAIAAAGVDPFTSKPKVRQLRSEARAWLLADDRAYLFSFVNICDALGFDVDYLRRGVRARTVVTAVKITGETPPATRYGDGEPANYPRPADTIRPAARL